MRYRRKKVYVCYLISLWVLVYSGIALVEGTCQEMALRCLFSGWSMLETGCVADLYQTRTPLGRRTCDFPRLVMSRDSRVDFGTINCLFVCLLNFLSPFLPFYFLFFLWFLSYLFASLLVYFLTFLILLNTLILHNLQTVINFSLSNTY